MILRLKAESYVSHGTLMQKQEKSNLSLLETEAVIQHVVPCHHLLLRVEIFPV